ncbi:hypothetical protein [uncultured Oscillibacter sp.]|uniref:hypothetical protein n=1 Tax=uncultured Oscillibacter sp. TaxID=876091 RepID=UPI002613C433|nr:hypothetical protein [uncultured Oscillibacter sp.]
MKSREMALCGLLSALAVMLLTLGGSVPLATFCAPVLAMAALLPVLEEYGPRAAGKAWIAVSLLALTLDPDREAALVYLCFGWYPLLRPKLAGLSSRPARTAARIAVCTGVCLLLYGVVWRALGLPEDPDVSGVFGLLPLALANVTFLLLDRALERLTLLWRRKLRRRVFRRF